MLVAVEKPRTRNTEAVSFKVEGERIPEWLLGIVREVYPTAKVEDGDDRIEISSTDWYKEMESRDTPARTLKIMRTAAGLTQKDLAKKLGIAFQNYNPLERGTRPITMQMAMRLADALGTSYEMFYKEK
ncbi:helix-turn-helix transcriptional regulator [Hallerella succinigenes]|uniref:Helix-turn-helix protein n=1 Tax=Hallerella succinigenes TaxID=1896222 RepID=A0A2M9A8E7_9BACT|nr:helix-turn-helix transcriptional regulator [Hallerella succinigenes]PJJ41893.1 helix-turn-helix protein [Hallerella succinigenes]